MANAGIYVRVSDDREGAGLGVARQEKDCRALAEQLGWTVVEVYPDNDLSAYNGKRRPNYQRLLDDIRAGRIDAIIAWHNDRLHRRPIELETFISIIEMHHVQIHTVRAGHLDLATASGRMIARQLGAVARYESEHKSERVKAKAQELADAGKIAAGGLRPFGYTRIYAGTEDRRKIVRDEINPEEAAVIRECVKRVLQGDSLQSVMRWLNEEAKVPTATGLPRWGLPSLRWMLRAGRLAGLREQGRRVVGNAVWPAIISVEEHQQLRAILDSHERLGPTVRQHYLTGLVVCDSCAQRETPPKMQVSRGKYVCPPKYLGGCRGRSIAAAPLAKLVRQYVLARADDPEILHELVLQEHHTDERSAGLVDRIEADERRLVVLEAELGDENAEDLPELIAAARRVRQRIRDARAELGRLAGVPSASMALLPDLAYRWPDLNVEQHRRATEVFVESVLIAPAVRGRNVFDPARVDIVPRRWSGRPSQP